MRQRYQDNEIQIIHKFTLAALQQSRGGRRARENGDTHHPSLAYRQEHVCRDHAAAFSKGMGASSGAWTRAEGRWQGRSPYWSSVDGTITMACVRLTFFDRNGREGFPLAGFRFKESKGLIDEIGSSWERVSIRGLGVARALSRTALSRGRVTWWWTKSRIDTISQPHHTTESVPLQNHTQ